MWNLKAAHQLHVMSAHNYYYYYTNTNESDAKTIRAVVNFKLDVNIMKCFIKFAVEVIFSVFSSFFFFFHFIDNHFMQKLLKSILISLLFKNKNQSIEFPKLLYNVNSQSTVEFVVIAWLHSSVGSIVRVCRIS